MRAQLEHDVALLGEDGLGEGERRGTRVDASPEAFEGLEEAYDLTKVDSGREVGLEQRFGAGVEGSDDFALGLGLLEHRVWWGEDIYLQTVGLCLQCESSVPLGRGVRTAVFDQRHRAVANRRRLTSNSGHCP